MLYIHIRFHLFRYCRTSQNTLLHLFIYIESYIETYKHIQNTNSYYKTHQQHLIHISKHRVFSNIHLFHNLDIHLNQRYPLIFMDRLWRA